jgi:predicted nucleic acid-binding protein
MYEVSKCPFEYKKEHIFAFIGKNASEYINAENQDTVVNLSKKIIASGIKPIDAAHIACAILSKCEYFITTDKRVLKYESDEIKIVNPMNFVEIWEGNYAE